MFFHNDKWMNFAIGMAIGFLVVGIANADPPQCNLPGWNTRATAKTVVVHQKSATHTHTCANPSCSFAKEHGEPFVWNHKMVEGHVCPHCNTSVSISTVNGRRTYVTGSGPVTVLQTVQTTPPVAQPPAPRAPVVAPRAAIRLPGT